jgi:hypothetical protein
MLAAANRLNVGDVSAVSELLKPYDARLMRCYPVSTRINSVVNDDEECSAPVEHPEIQDGLFQSQGEPAKVLKCYHSRRAEFQS